MTDALPNYDGLPLIPKESIFRHVPKVLNPEQRMRLDALLFTADAIHFSWQQLTSAASSVSDDPNLPPILRTAIFVSAWTIVDYLDAARQLIKGMVPKAGEAGPRTKDILATLETARVLRNKRQHLSGNLQNRAGLTGTRSALFGAVGFTKTPIKAGDPFSIVVLHSGALHGTESMMAVNPAGRTIRAPVDLFQIDAFEICLEIGPSIAAFKLWLEDQEKLIFEELSKAINSLAAKHGVSKEELWEHNGGGLTVILTAIPGKPGSEE